MTLNDDIFLIKNIKNSFIDYLICSINTDIIPANEYQNKIYLGNIFLSNKLDSFYQTNLNITIGYKNYWFNNLSNKLLNKTNNKYENSIYLIELRKNHFNKNYVNINTRFILLTPVTTIEIKKSKLMIYNINCKKNKNKYSQSSDYNWIKFII